MGPNITSADNNRWKCRRNKVVPINLAARSVRTTRTVLRNIWTKTLTEFQIIYKSHLLLALNAAVCLCRLSTSDPTVFTVSCDDSVILYRMHVTHYTLHITHYICRRRRNKKNSPSHVVQKIVAVTRQMQMHNKVYLQSLNLGKQTAVFKD